MDHYTIKKAYPFEEGLELEISGDGLTYTEIYNSVSGVQVMNEENEQLIHDKCRQVADLIREIDQLNKV